MADYAIACAIMCALAWMSRDRFAVMGACIVAGNWMAWTGFIQATGIYEPWHFGIAIDTIAAGLLLYQPSSRPKSILAGLFVVQIAMHVAYGMAEMTTPTPDNLAYYTNLSLVGWLQLFAVGVWAGGDIGGRVLHNWRVRHPRVGKQDRPHLDRRG